MSKSMLTLGMFVAISLGSLANSVDAAALLLPAIQAAREAANRSGCNADTDGDGKADAIVWMGNVPTADGDTLPVLMVIANQDFYYQEYADTRIVGKGDDARLEMSGPAFVGRFDRDGKYVGAVCYGVSVLAYARVDGSDKPAPVLTIGTDDGEPFLLGVVLMY
jgi:hypothetical protein